MEDLNSTPSSGTRRHDKENIISSGSEGASDNESDGNPPIRSRRKKATLRSRRSRSSRRASIASQEKHFVQHNYHDHSHDVVEDKDDVLPSVESTEEEKTSQQLARRKGHRGGVAVPFPEKLHFMLSRMDQEGTSKIVAWQPHGRCFIVQKPKEFVEEIMPRFFKQTKLTSFQRQLNLYGFSRLTAGPDRGGYYHELFLRGRMDLCRKMVRTRVKGNGSKAAASPATEPNFYAMEPCEDETRNEVLGEQGDQFLIPISDPLSEEYEPDEIGLPIDDSVTVDEEQTSLIQQDPKVTAALILDVPPTPPLTPRMTRGSDSVSCHSPTPSTSFPLQATSLSFSSLPPIVSPECVPKYLVSAPAVSSEVISSLSISSELVFPPRDFQSGDQIFFEGLPFHYLETKDVEDSLIVEA